MSILTAPSLLATAYAAIRSTGAGPPRAIASFVVIELVVTPSGASTRQSRWPDTAPSASSRPRSRFSGVNRQTSSRPVGRGWSARS